MWRKLCVMTLVAAVAGFAFAGKTVPGYDPDGLTSMPVPNTTGGRDITVCYPQSASRWTGSVLNSTITDTSMIRCVEYEVGWAKFDISAIPDDASIWSVTLYVYVNDTYWPWWMITPVSCDPVTCDAQTLYDDIMEEYNQGSGFYNNNQETDDFAPGWHSYVLGGTATADLQAALPQDWFAVGMLDYDFSTTYYLIMDGWAQANPPYIEVEWGTGPPPAEPCGFTGNACGPYHTESAWLADMAWNPNTQTMYQVVVGGTNGIMEWDPATCEELNYCTPSWLYGYSQRGIAYNPDADRMYVGGWNEGLIYTLTPPPDCYIENYCAPALYAISGLAWDTELGVLWILTNSSPDMLYAVDPTTCATVYGPYTVGWMCGTDGYDAGGLAWVPGGNFLAINQYTQSSIELLDRNGNSSACCDLVSPTTYGWGIGFPTNDKQLENCWVSEIYSYMDNEHYAPQMPCPGPSDLTCGMNPSGGIDLAWVNNDVYDSVLVYRNDAQIATLPGDATSYHDDAVTGPAAYTYYVKSYIGDWMCSSSNECTVVYASVAYFFDFNEGDMGFTHTVFPGCIDDWQYGPYDGYPPPIGCEGVPIDYNWGTVIGGYYSYAYSGGRLMSVPILLDEDYIMEICHYYDIESYWDGGNVKISTDGGATFTLIYPEAGYPEDAMSTANCAIPGEPGFSGASGAWVQDYFDLSDYTGNTVIIAFDFGSDGSVNYPGWYIKWLKVLGPPVGVTETALRKPAKFMMAEARPTPFMNTTEIEFSLPEKATATVNVYDVSGKLVKTLLSGTLDAGRHTVTWNGTDNVGRSVQSGVYFVKLTAGKHEAVRKVIFVK